MLFFVEPDTSYHQLTKKLISLQKHDYAHENKNYNPSKTFWALHRKLFYQKVSTNSEQVTNDNFSKFTISEISFYQKSQKTVPFPRDGTVEFSAARGKQR